MSLVGPTFYLGQRYSFLFWIDLKVSDFNQAPEKPIREGQV